MPRLAIRVQCCLVVSHRFPNPGVIPSEAGVPSNGAFALLGWRSEGSGDELSPARPVGISRIANATGLDWERACPDPSLRSGDCFYEGSELRTANRESRFTRTRHKKIRGRSWRPLYGLASGSLVLLAALLRTALF